MKKRNAKKNEGETSPRTGTAISKKRRRVLNKYKDLLIGAVCAAVLGCGVSGCSSFKIGSLPPLDGDRDSSVPDSGHDGGSDGEASVPDAAIDSSIPDSSLPEASVPEASIPDAEVDSTAPDASTVVCTGMQSENETVVIWMNQSREIGGFCFWYVNNSPATVNIECNADASCNGGETVRPGIELTVGVPHQEVINGVTITLTVNSATASQLNITIDVSAP